MNTSSLTALYIGLCICTAEIRAQLPEVEFSYIPDLPVYCRAQDILRDQDGMLWFAHLSAGEGIFVHDGVYTRQIKADRSDPVSLTDAEIQDMMLAGDGRIWLSTLNYGICIYDPETDHFSHLDFGAFTDAPNLHAQHIYAAPDDIVWIASSDGLVRYDAQDSSWQRFMIESTDILMQPDDMSAALDIANLIRHICPDPIHPNRLWLGTAFGLFAFDARSSTYTHHAMPFSARAEVGRPTEQYLIMDLVFVTPRRLIAATWGGGLLEYDLEHRAWKRYRDPAVQPTQDVYWDLELLDTARLWINSMGGFGVFDRSTASFTYYDSIPTPTPFTGNLWFASAMEQINSREIVVSGSTGGAIVQLTDEPVENTLYPPLVRQVDIDGKPVPPTNNRYARRYQKLGADQQDLAITVVAPIFHDQEKVRYRYSWSGDDRWQASGSGRIELSGVAAGRHELRFQASLDGTSWIDGEVWTIEKFGPVWQTGGLWLVIGCIVAGGLLLWSFLVVQQRRKRALLERSYKHRLAESEISALRAQMNPHFIFNSLNSIKMYVMKQETHLANHYLTRFSHLMRLILRHSKSKLISLADELKALRLYTEIEQLRFDEAFSTEFQIAEDVEPEDYFIPPMLLQPYVENAIWHGLMHLQSDGLLRIQIAKEGMRLRIIIEDNGVGRAAANTRSKQEGLLKKSYGTRITQDRIELIKQSLDIHTSVTIEDLSGDDNKPAGTRVILILPCIHPAQAKALIQEEQPQDSS